MNKRQKMIAFLICLSGFVGLASTAWSQGETDIIIVCDADFTTDDITLPEALPGQYFAYLRPGHNPSHPVEFDRYTAEGVERLQAPLTPEQALSVDYPLVSPDGNLVVFRPNNPRQGDQTLYVWDVETDEVASFNELSAEEWLTHIEPTSPIEEYVNRARWADSSTLVIDFVEVGDDFSIQRTTARQEILFSRSPLTVELGERITFVYPDLPIPEGNRPFSEDSFPVRLSPLGTYALSISWASNFSSPRHVQIYDTNSLDLLLDWPPSEDFRPTLSSAWSPNETWALFPYGTTREESQRSSAVGIAQVSIVGGEFSVDLSLTNRLVEAFGVDISVSFGPTLAPDGERVTFQAYRTQQGSRYWVIYAPETGEMTAICDDTEALSNSEGVHFIWSPDMRYFGYWQFGGLAIVFDVETGQGYRLPDTADWVGWVSGSE
jgi:hypothetical protein